MFQVSGIVMVKETGVGISRVLVEVYDVDPGTKPEELISFEPATGIEVNPGFSGGVALAPMLGERLFSIATDEKGEFRGEFTDSDFRQRNPDEQRPDLLLMVRAPEDMDSAPNTRILHVSNEVRQNAATAEAYIIRISSAKLVAAGLTLPTAVHLDTEEPTAVVLKVNQAVSRQVKINQEVQKIAAQQVAAERARALQVEKQIESSLVEKLTGVPAQLAERLNYVPPGGNVETAMYAAINKTIDGSINKSPPAQSFVVLTAEQAQKFKKPDGTFRDDITPAELEPFLFGAAQSNQRPTVIVREDPVALLRKGQQVDLLGQNGTTDGNGGGPSHTIAAPSPAAPGALPSPGDTPPAIPDFVNRLLGTVTSPEEAVLFGVKPRATQESLQTDIGAFHLGSGPADVTAYYDFHSLQIAFDYVWQKAIDEGVIENAQTLSKQLLDLGGDPIGAISNGSDPVKALRKELLTVQTAHASANLGIMFAPARPLPNGNGAERNGSGPVSPLPPRARIPDVSIPVNPNGVFTQDTGPQPNDLLNQIEGLLNQRYAFEIFAPGSINFGILVSYQQRWEPINYQVGSLVKTLTLAPKETRKVSTKRVVKKDRSVKEMEDSLRVRKEESKNTGRDEAEIIAKAEAKTNFNLTAKGAYNIGISKGDSTMVFGKDAATNSSDTKKAFREAVLSASQEYKDERRLEVETKESYEEEVTETAEITNPNDELPVTFLFYELQRRFKISETIHRLSPVVLVAMDVPNPGRSSIDALLLTYGWIINRVLLDDQFRRPLEYLRIKIVGDEYALSTMAQNISVLTGVVNDLKKSYTKSQNDVKVLADLLTAQMVARAQAVDAEHSEGLWGKAKEAVVGGGSNDDVEAARILEDAARECYERAVNQERELRSQLDSETAALNSANNAYARANAEHLNCLVDVGALRVHIKENILYYMQAIWSHTFQDQLFLTLHKRKAPRLTTQKQTYSLAPATPPPASVSLKPGQSAFGVQSTLKLNNGLDPDKDFVTLVEVADLDNLLGFKGNYLIYPLKVSNALTDFMMTPYVDAELGLRDPDEFGNWTPEQFVTYARALHEQLKQQLARGEITEAQLKAAVDDLTQQYKRILSAPRRAEDEITVPTGSLFIEALPGTHPILEDFKLMHRAIDVKKVQAEVRKMEMENVRYAARLLAGEREDPDVEKKIVVEGQGVIVNPDTN
jgi:hypothetical protein